MPLIKDDHVVETLTSNGADHPFDEWILPRGARCGKDLLYPETVDATIEVRSVGLVSVPYQVPRRRVPWKSIDHLLRRLLGGRMLGDIEMNDTATLVAKDDEDEQNSEGCGRQSEKVRLSSCRVMGDFVISPLPRLLTKELCAAGPLCSTGVAPFQRYYGPSRHRLVFDCFPGASGYAVYLAPSISRRDEDGFSSCLACPCHRAALLHRSG